METGIVSLLADMIVNDKSTMTLHKLWIFHHPLSVSYMGSALCTYV